MVKKKGIKKVFRSRKGGIGAIIAMVVSIILVLSLIAYTVLAQVAGAKDTGDRAQIEQDKINQMLQDPSIVTGNVVESYYNQQSQGGFTVSITQSDGTTAISKDKVVEGALFKESKSYNADGKLASLKFIQVNLSR